MANNEVQRLARRLTTILVDRSWTNDEFNMALDLVALHGTDDRFLSWLSECIGFEKEKRLEAATPANTRHVVSSWDAMWQ